MLPIDHFEGFYTSDQKDFLKYIDTMNYEYTYGTKNFYNTTTHNLSAIFHLDRIFDKNNQLKYKGLYPMMLKEGFFSPKLILNLEKWGYQFKWVGNTFAYCSIINIKYCLEKKNTFINPDLFVTFLKASPAVHIAIILGGFNYDKNFLYRDNNGIYKLKENLEKNKTLISSNRPTFYFVHHFSPHWPYITDRDCNYTEAYPDTINLEGYKEAYLCNLKRIKEMINFLNINDPNSFVVFQSDHSWEMSKLSEQKYGNRNEIFNLVKLDKDCKLDKNENLNNVNIMLLIISCITGNEISKID